MKKAKFSGEIISGHKGAAVEVPFDPATKWAIEARALWPGRRGHVVQCEINGTKFGSCIVPRLRKFWLLIDDEVQKHIGASIGDTVAVVVEPIDPSSDAK